KGWRGPLGAAQFFGRGVGSIAVKQGDSKTVFVATGRATRGISNTCCGGTDALVPGAPHFGVWRSKDEGKSWELVNQGAEALCTVPTPDVVSLNQTACSPRGARRIKFDPVDPNTVYASFFARGIWRSRSSVYPGALHPDHHALVVNPLNWRQFFDLSDGGVNRSNGVFVNDTADCTTAPHLFVVPSRVAFCQVVLSRVPQRLTAINRGLRT